MAKEGAAMPGKGGIAAPGREMLRLEAEARGMPRQGGKIRNGGRVS